MIKNSNMQNTTYLTRDPDALDSIMTVSKQAIYAFFPKSRQI